MGFVKTAGKQNEWRTFYLICCHFYRSEGQVVGAAGAKCQYKKNLKNCGLAGHLSDTNEQQVIAVTV